MLISLIPLKFKIKGYVVKINWMFLDNFWINPQRSTRMLKSSLISLINNISNETYSNELD
ncbi:hypothetical protein J5U23_01917 [Saccharolobus shibatae B12]|uniref:Uncharacterized protein n=2 Tax=Saccharolobus shibatae TaxID=2286 RepID=A0A8F5BPS1_SACSH|nr:hypothetical protein J5U23_01917 [Saccharolobus shibatae B12]QXJ35298.1 hypothetical protein J5U22_01845 [Saccharolobus shibatae]